MASKASLRSALARATAAYAASSGPFTISRFFNVARMPFIDRILPVTSIRFRSPVGSRWRSMNGRMPEHVSQGVTQTTGRYLGCKQKLRCAVNHRIGIEPDDARRSVSAGAIGRPLATSEFLSLAYLFGAAARHSPTCLLRGRMERRSDAGRPVPLSPYIKLATGPSPLHVQSQSTPIGYQFDAIVVRRLGGE